MGKYLEETILRNGNLVDMMMRLNAEITAYGVPVETIELVLGEGISDAESDGSCYLFIDKVPNYHDGGTENDVEWGFSLPEYAEHAWKIECIHGNEESESKYSITRVTKDITSDEIEKLKDEIESLRNKNMNLSRTLVNIVNAKSKISCGEVELSEEDFIRMIKAEEDVAVEDENEDGLWDEFTHGEFKVSWKGFTATIHNCPAMAEMWSQIAYDYE